MRKFGKLILVVIVVVLGLAAFIRSGVYNVSARVPHYKTTTWLLDTVKEWSIIKHATDIRGKSIAGNAGDSETGITHYHAMCRRCHGAPGILRDEFALGLYPSPPELAAGEEQEEWTDIELFWIVSNGLKLTGMPAFGDTHTREEIWEIIRMINIIPEMNSDQYQNQLKRFGIIDNESHGHHEASTPHLETGHEHQH